MGFLLVKLAFCFLVPFIFHSFLDLGSAVVSFTPFYRMVKRTFFSDFPFYGFLDVSVLFHAPLPA